MDDLYNNHMLQTKACGVIVFRNKPVRSFLLLVHPQRWDLPKGHLDRGETEMQCALRELREETGIGPDHIDVDPSFRFTTNYPVRYKNKSKGQIFQKTLVIFLAWLKQDVSIQTTEHPMHQWITWNPPHLIQKQTIDPLLTEVAEYFSEK